MPTHDERIRRIVSEFRDKHREVLSELEGVEEAAATRPGPDAGWSPAQIGWHLATSEQRMAAALAGERPIAQPAAPDFREDWDAVNLPPKAKAAAALEPPPDVTRSHAVESLRSAQERVVSALEGLTPERATHTIAFPFGTLSLYQTGEFLTRHLDRHLGQLRRARHEA